MMPLSAFTPAIVPVFPRSRDASGTRRRCNVPSSPGVARRSQKDPRLCGAFIRLGTTKIRITGGEPLVRRDVIRLFGSLGARLGSGLKELTVTTNGTQLAKHAEAREVLDRAEQVLGQLEGRPPNGEGHPPTAGPRRKARQLQVG